MNESEARSRESSTMTIKVAKKSYKRLQDALHQLTGKIQIKIKNKKTGIAELRWKSPSMQMLIDECLVRSLEGVVADLKNVMTTDEVEQDFEIIFTPENVRRARTPHRT